MIGIMALGVALRLGYCWRVWPKELPNTDNYTALASSFANTWSLSENGQPSAHREPLYPALLGFGFKVFGQNFAAVIILNCLLGCLTLLLIYKAGEQLFAPIVGLLATAIAAAYPPFIYYTAQPVRETLIIFIATLSVWMLLLAARWERPAAFAAAGLANALAGLTNTPFLPFGLILAPLTLWRLAFQRKARPWPWLAPYLTAFVLLYSLWPIRNYLAFGTWVLGSVGSGAASNFYEYQIVPQELGGTPEHVRIVAADPIIQEGSKLPLVEREHFFWKAGLAHIRQNPAAYLKLVAWRFWDLCRLAPRPRNYEHSYSAVYWASLLTNGWIIPLGLLGIFLTRLNPPEMMAIYGFLFSLSFTYALIFTLLRYRLPLMPWLIILASSTLERARSFLTRARL